MESFISPPTHPFLPYVAHPSSPYLRILFAFFTLTPISPICRTPLFPISQNWILFFALTPIPPICRTPLSPHISECIILFLKLTREISAATDGSALQVTRLRVELSELNATCAQQRSALDFSKGSLERVEPSRSFSHSAHMSHCECCTFFFSC